VRPRKNSGQILLITAFIMASLLLSAQLYILEVGKNSGETGAESLGDFMQSVKLGSRHVIFGSLANASNGGPGDVLELNLRRWASFVGSQYLHGKSTLNYTVAETTTYSTGLWLDWGVSSYGVSSAFANFTHSLSGREADVEQPYFINATTSLVISSTNRRLNETSRQVNVTLNLLNEAEPALADSITTHYRVSNNWLIPDETNNYVLQNYGNGTYLASFTATFPSSQVEVSAHVVDHRDIFVQANVTSTEA